MRASSAFVCTSLVVAAASLLLLVDVSVVSVSAHGSLTWPPSNRQGGTLDSAGICSDDKGDCFWFSQITEIPGWPTVNATADRTYNVLDASGGPSDFTRRMPWRAPGTAPVRGSGCGVAGGSPIVLFNGGISPVGIPQGTDGLDLPEQAPYPWALGSVQEVAFGIRANHGGGYSYRMCPLGDDGDTSQVTEECFQKMPLQFAGNQQWIQYGDEYPGQPRYELPPPRIVTEGTFPPGSQWARNPIPACALCSQADCGPGLQPNWTEPSGTFPWGDQNVTYYGGKEWIDETHCGVVCAGESLTTSFVNNRSRTDGILCPAGQTQFAEPFPGISGFVQNQTYPARSLTAFNIVDRIQVPTTLPVGRYLLSWRWDAEQSPQIWQNCADIQIVQADEDEEVLVATS